jgi:hypothetical protein
MRTDISRVGATWRGKVIAFLAALSLLALATPAAARSSDRAARRACSTAPWCPVPGERGDSWPGRPGARFWVNLAKTVCTPALDSLATVGISFIDHQVKHLDQVG